MTVTLTWDNPEETIILCEFTGVFGIENYAALEGDLPMMVAEASHRVDVIACLMPGASLPVLRSILPEFGILTNIMPPNFGMIVGVGHGFLLTNFASIGAANVLINLYYQKAQHKIFVTASRDAARHLIQRQIDSANDPRG